MSALTDFFTSLANKVRSKLGTTTKYSPSQAVNAIDDVYNKGVTDTKKGNASRAEVRYGYSFTSNTAGVNQSGTMPERSSSSQVKGDKAWASNGRMYFGIDYGYYPSGRYGNMDAVSEKFISNAALARDIGLTAANIINGKSILGITGTGKTPNENSRIYPATQRASQIDMGASNDYRYVNTNGVPNSNSQKYSATGRTSSASINGIDLGATNTYRYVNTYAVPNRNDGTYSFPARSAGETIDLGETNTVRKVNAQKVYERGLDDGITYMYMSGSTSWTGNDATTKQTFTCTKRGLHLVIAYSTTTYMPDSSLYVDFSGSGELEDNVYHIDTSSSGSRVIIKQVSACMPGTKIYARGGTGCKILTIKPCTYFYD